MVLFNPVYVGICFAAATYYSMMQLLVKRNLRYKYSVVRDELLVSFST